MTRLTGASRVSSPVRASVATVEVVVFSSLTHTAAGGGLPGTGTLLALGGLVAACALALRHRLLRLRDAVGLAVLAQVCLHSVLEVGHTAHADMDTATGLSTGMVLAHCVSAVFTLLALVWQEQVLAALTAACTPTLSVTPPPHRRHLGPVTEQAAPSLSLLKGCAPLRGPPLPGALAALAR